MNYLLVVQVFVRIPSGSLLRGNQQEQLAPLLAECSDYFIQARYAYEQIGGSYNLSGIRTLAKGLLDAVKAFGTKNH